MVFRVSPLSDPLNTAKSNLALEGAERMKSCCLLLICLLTIDLAHAQTSQSVPLPPPAGESVLTPKIACADLRSLTNYDFSIESATLIAAGTDAPARCRVKGLIQPEIQFEVNLPAAWNRRFFMFGNGGYAGEPMDAGNRVGQRLTAIRRGFVVADHNTGHDSATEPLGTFAVNRQKLLDYAFRSLHTTADTGKRIAEAYFGAKPAKSYYEGCSTGGRQGLILAQRFPEDFDGLVIGAPVLNFSGTMTAYAQTVQALARAPIPYAKLSTLAERIYAHCDDKDGLKDGLIDDPRNCDFRPARDLPKCADGADKNDCFTAAQISALEFHLWGSRNDDLEHPDRESAPDCAEAGRRRIALPGQRYSHRRPGDRYQGHAAERVR